MTLAARIYGGTGKTLDELDALPRHEREAILAGTISMLREQLAEIRQQLSESEGMLRDAMLERGATVADAGPWTVKLTTRRSYSYDEEALAGLQAYVEPDVYDQAVHTVTTVKVNKTVLNRLSKRGGEIKTIIDQSITAEWVDGYTLDVGRA